MLDLKMGRSPKVSVVVLNWNAKEVLRECLKSIQKSNYPIEEIIVVDNGSKDGSQQMIKELFSDLVLLENGENLGVAEGKNRGLLRALQKDIDYIYSLDNDLTMDAAAISELVALMESYYDIGCSGSIIYYHGRRNIVFNAGHYVNWTQNLVKSRGRNQKDKGQFEGITEVDFVGGGAMLIRKHILTEIGLLDPDYIGYGYEDTDLGQRIKKAGYRVVCCGRSKVWHRPFTGIGNYSFKKKYLESRNAIRFLRIYGNKRNWAKFMVYAVIGIFYASVREGLRGNIRGVIGKARGLYDGFRGKEDLARNLMKL